MNGTYQGMQIIKRWEQCRLRAFIPIAGDPWTIGWGATGPGIVEGLTWTQEEADANLANRCATLASLMRPHFPTSTTDNEFGACLSLAYNVGISAFLSSTLMHYIQQEKFDLAAGEFLKWDKAHGKTVQGLLNRRRDEQHVFLT